jgi:lipopolysaccharide transport system permease protein
MSALHRVEYEIAPPKSAVSIDWPELWRFRDLFLVMSWRDLSVRYKQTALGVLWAIFQPLLTTIVFTVIFGGVGKIPTSSNADLAKHVPYPVFVLTGLVCWQFYSGTITKMSEAMVANAQMIQKVYFPRLIIPGSMTLSGLVDMSIVSVILGIMMACYGFTPHLVGVAIIPLLVLTLVMTAVGQGLFCSALNVRYRDVRYALPFIVQTMMFVTPVIYPVDMLDRHPPLKLAMIWLNPISGTITNARAGLIGDGHVDWTMLAISLLMSTVYLILGLIYFRKTERHFADIV